MKTVNVSDLLEVLAARLQYFRSKPAYGLFFVDIYTVGGWFWFFYKFNLVGIVRIDWSICDAASVGARYVAFIPAGGKACGNGLI